MRRLDLLGVFLGDVAKLGELGVTEEGVVVEADLCVEELQVAVRCDDQRIDLEEAHVLVEEGLVERREDGLRVGRGRAFELQGADDPGDIGGRDAGRRVDVDGDDLFGRVVGDALDVHAALGRDDEGDAAHGAVDEQRAVELAGDVGAGFDVEAVDGLAALAGLLGDEGLAQHLGGVGDDVGDGFDDADATLGIGAEFLEPALAAAAGVDLRFDHVDRAGEGFCGGFRLVRLEDGDALADGEAVFTENGFGLMLVDVHSATPSWFDRLTMRSTEGTSESLRTSS